MSNTKVSSFGYSKNDARDIISDFIGSYPHSEFYQNPENGVTVLVTREFIGARVARVSTAVMSPDEKKFRKLVGKIQAVENMHNYQYINVPIDMLCNTIWALGAVG